jgi:hypothetical protein
MVCAPELMFVGIDGVGSHFHVLPSRNHFRYQVSFSCFALPNPFSAVPSASGPVFIFCALDSFSTISTASGTIFMFCALGPIFGGTEGVGSCFYVLRFLTHFWRYRGCRVPFPCLGIPVVPRASGAVLMFCAPGFIFGGTEGVGFRFLVLGSRWYRGRRVPFSCFALLNLFSSGSTASGTVFMFCPPGPIFGGTEGVESRFHILRSLTHFRRYRGRQVPFSCFGLLEPFSAVPTTSGSISCFALHDSFLSVSTASGSVFMFCSPELAFGGIDGVGSRFHVLRSRTHFRPYRRRRVPFSCFALPDSFSTVTATSGTVFMF